ncbi:hypothetical protein CEXT_534881 [Caerostris extrusa]|uniref:Uncharacterized protein n=1 Tax=Caerostris extrusa TaxID=172846 RepID=A0AAV4XQJ4_CAEEX|nr:hypothetical protein CEXT_534881 [Caerostris extrusa]
MSGIYERRIKKEGKEGEAIYGSPNVYSSKQMVRMDIYLLNIAQNKCPTDVDELIRLDIGASVAVLQQCIRSRVKAILSITAMHMWCLSSRVDVALSTPLSSV